MQIIDILLIGVSDNNCHRLNVVLFVLYVCFIFFISVIALYQ